MGLQPSFLCAFFIAAAYGADGFRAFHALIPKAFSRKYLLGFWKSLVLSFHRVDVVLACSVSVFDHSLAIYRPGIAGTGSAECVPGAHRGVRVGQEGRAPWMAPLPAPSLPLC